ncbi:putative ABC transporter H family member 2 [Blattamonas nauphoetae]|uniref:ABC transporter H family member 2 n=1 Tax=Blattamonas nauphoetae TaxID=2049346 RepID=A0ABQ9XI61_9EUKA|nr:putative ABC transporter H family member 2 [Blattamonas nauphoetae]
MIAETTKAAEEAQDEPFIVVENVHKTYLLGVEGVAALRGVNLEIHQGEFVMICGTSGGGKSTLLNIIGTIDKPTKGRITLCGKQITPRTTDDELATIRLKHLGFVFQTFNLLASMTALENVELPLTFRGYGPKRRKEKAKKLLERVQMGDRLTHYPSMLSGGEQQRVTIARALANSPGLLLLDEPTGDLDTLNTNNVMKILVDLNRKNGITLVMVTHDMNLIAYASRCVFVRDGKVAYEKRTKEEDRRKKIRELEEAIEKGQDGNKATDNLGVEGKEGGEGGEEDERKALLMKKALAGSHSVKKRKKKDRPAGGVLGEGGEGREGGERVHSDWMIPVCSSVREPCDYDPVAFCSGEDEEGMACGFEIVVEEQGDTKTLFRQFPLSANPYSNLRMGSIGRKEEKVKDREIVSVGRQNERFLPLNQTHHIPPLLPNLLNLPLLLLLHSPYKIHLLQARRREKEANQTMFSSRTKMT